MRPIHSKYAAGSRRTEFHEDNHRISVGRTIQDWDHLQEEIWTDMDSQNSEHPGTLRSPAWYRLVIILAVSS